MKNSISSEHRTITDITSASNPLLKVWRSLLSGKGVKKHALTLVSGVKAVSDVIGSSSGCIRQCIISSHGDPALPEYLPPVPVYRLRHELYREIDMFGTSSPLLVVGVPSMKTLNELPDDSPVVLMVPFQDPVNVGSVIRSAAAFGVRTIVLLKEAANPYHPRSIRASSAQVFRVACYEGPSINDLPTDKMPVLALDAGGFPLDRYDFPESFFLLPGIEGPGLPDELSPVKKLSIPIEPDVESLNASVAVSIALYEWKRRLSQK